MNLNLNLNLKIKKKMNGSNPAADRVLCVKANKLRIQKMLYSTSGCNAMT